jgi:hypothetical protein
LTISSRVIWPVTSCSATRRGRFGGGGLAAVDRLAQPVEQVPVPVGHAEQLADHQRRHRKRERAHQVGRVRASQHDVDEVVDNTLDLRAQLLDLLDEEVGAQLPSLLRMLGIIGVDECLAPLLPRLHPFAHMRETGVSRVSAHAPVG